MEQQIINLPETMELERNFFDLLIMASSGSGLSPVLTSTKPRANHRSEREANRRLKLFVGPFFQRGTQMS